MAEEYKFSKKILDDQQIEAKVGNHIKVKLEDGVEIEGKIIKVDGDQIMVVKE
jgi:FKBP-type peptidyl-prolyl cis-trans isomerase 2